MEIKTARIVKHPERNEAVPFPEKSRYLRRKTTQKLRRSRGSARVLWSGFKLLGILVASGMAAAALIWLSMHAYSSDKFVLRSITFIGCRQANAQELEDIVRKTFPQHVLKLDLAAVRDRLEKEPWVLRAEIRRMLPADLLIYIHERSPAAIVEIAGELMVADAEGILLGKYEPRHGKLDTPVFRGLLGDTAKEYRRQLEDNSERVRLGLKMLAELESGSSAFTRNISEVDLSDKTNVRLLLIDDTAEVSLGDRDFLKRYRAFIANAKQYEELKAQYSEIISVDLRYDGQIIYRPRQAAGAPAKVKAEQTK